METIKSMLLSLSFFGPMVSNLIIYKKTQSTLKFKRRHREFEWTKATQQLTLSPIGVADSEYFPLDPSSTNTADADTPSLSLHDVDGLRVRNSRHSIHPRRFVFGKFVRKLNCSWSEAFVNRGLTVFQTVFIESWTVGWSVNNESKRNSKEEIGGVLVFPYL
jgi:hypothetical protein